MFVLLSRIFPSQKIFTERMGCIITIIVAVLAVISRNHYTIDVIGALIMVFFLKKYI